MILTKFQLCALKFFYFCLNFKTKIMSDILAAGKKQGAQQADIQATVDLVLGPTKPLSKCIAAIGNKSSDRHFCFS